MADHHRAVAAKEKPVRSATSTPFNVAAKDLQFVWLLGLKKNADAVQGAEHRTNDYYDEEIHQSVPRRRWFRQLIIGVKSSDLERDKPNGAEGREMKSGKAVERLHGANCGELFGI